jgi:hypothetical protein
MRNLFRGYYRPSPEDFTKLWNEAIFVFDTNVLLNIYRYSSVAQSDFFNILEKLQGRIWIPHQVALEYFENRENVIDQQHSIHKEIECSLNKTLTLCASGLDGKVS